MQSPVRVGKKFRAATVIAVALGFASAPAMAQTVGQDVYTVLQSNPTAAVVVALRSPTPADEGLDGLLAAVAQIQDDVLARLTASDFKLLTRWKAVPGFFGDVDQSGLAKLAADPNVERVDLDMEGAGNLAESVPLIGADLVHGAYGVTGKGVNVAVLDSGIDLDHPDLQSSIAGEQCFCRFVDGTGCCPNGATTQSGNGSAQDDHSHGTFVSGVITSDGNVASAGVAPDAGIVAVKVNNSSNSGFASDWISGLDWLITDRPDVRVANMSSSTAARFANVCDGFDAVTMGLASAITTLRQRGTMFFAATGNNADAMRIGAPACVGDAFAVGATYDADVGFRRFSPPSFGRCRDHRTFADQVTCYSNSNAHVAFLAPGSIITTDALGGGTLSVHGTSFASPHAAGVAALLLEADPTLTVDDMNRQMQLTRANVTDPRNGLTIPRVDALFAVGFQRVRTELLTRPAVAEVIPTVGVFLNFAATLRRAGGDHRGVPQQEVVFTAGAFRCTATTDDNGNAACGGITDSLNAIANLGYTATYDSFNFVYQSTSAHGPLVGVAGIRLP